MAAFDPQLNTNGDNAQFLILGESILQGKGLSHINTPNDDPHTKYPFFYPLVVAGVLAVFPEGLVAVKLVNVVMGVAAAGMALALFRRRGHPILGLLVALVVAVSPHVLEFCRIALAEIPYLCLTLATLLLLEKAIDGDRPGWRLVTLCLLGIMAGYYTKSVGVALAVAAPLAFALRRHYRVALFLLVGFAMLSFPWYLRNKSVGQGNLYLDYFLMRNPYLEGSGQITGGEFLQRIGKNAVRYERYLIPNAVLPVGFEYGARGAPGIERVAFVLPTLLIIVGLVSALRRRRFLMEIYTVLYLGVVHVWPDVWSSTRFLVPILPMLIGYFALGVAECVRWGFSEDAGRKIAVAVLLAVAVANLWATVGRLPLKGRVSRDWANFYRAADWIRQNTPPDAIVASRKSYILYWKTHRKTVGYRFNNDPAAVYRGLVEDRAQYILVDSFYWTSTTAKYLVPTLVEHQSEFPIRWNTDDPPTFVVENLALEAGG